MSLPDPTPRRHAEPLERVLASLAPLQDADIAFLRRQVDSPLAHAAGSEIADQAGAPASSRVAVAGWVGWTYHHPDGRRQIAALALPGDRLQACAAGRLPMANIALTPVRTVDVAPLLAAFAERRPEARNLAVAWRAMEAAAEARNLAQLLRLGRMSAYERMANLLVELKERQARAGLLGPRGMSLPLTQETLGDLLGISTVHVNRTLQQMRREGLLDYRGGAVVLPDEAALGRIAGLG